MSCTKEACDVQLRDLDLCVGTLTARSGKGRKARRIPLHPDAIRLLERYLTHVRCPQGVPALGSDDCPQDVPCAVAAMRS